MKRRAFIAGLSALTTGFVLDEATGLLVPKKKMRFVLGQRALPSDPEPVIVATCYVHDELVLTIRADATSEEIAEAALQSYGFGDADFTRALAEMFFTRGLT